MLKDLHGHETFKDGEVDSHIEIDLPKLPQKTNKETFMWVVQFSRYFLNP